MKSKIFWIAVLSGAVLTTLVSNLPFIDMVNFLCFVGFWGSALFAVWLYRRLEGALTLRRGVVVGTLTGLCAGVLGFALSFAGWAGLQGMTNELAVILPAQEMGELANLPLWGVTLINSFFVLINVAFGAIGGLLGGAIFRTDRKIKKEGV